METVSPAPMGPAGGSSLWLSQCRGLGLCRLLAAAQALNHGAQRGQDVPGRPRNKAVVDPRVWVQDLVPGKVR